MTLLHHYNESNSIKEEPYYFENGYRKVHPHVFLYTTYTKGRWRNMQIYALFCKEFKDRDAEYYKEAIVTGKIKVNGKIVDLCYALQPNDKITHELIREEPDVLAEPVEVICKTEEFLFVNKPPTIPVHPAGRYFYNSLLKIVQHDCDLTEEEKNNLGVINRLDRLVSGIVVISLTKASCTAIQKEMLNHQIRKTYVCKVKGLVEWDQITVDKPISVVNHKRGISAVDLENGKPSVTHFKVIHRDSENNVSYLYCYPKTGRTHQIRVAISHLGHPIVNDTKYDPSYPDWCTDTFTYICLHALRYETDQWSYTSSKPFWIPKDIIIN